MNDPNPDSAESDVVSSESITREIAIIADSLLRQFCGGKQAFFLCYVPASRLTATAKFASNIGRTEAIEFMESALEALKAAPP